MAGSWGRDILQIRGVVGHLCISRQVARKDELTPMTPFIVASGSIGKVVLSYCEAWNLGPRYHPRKGWRRTLHDYSANADPIMFALGE